MKFFFGRMIVLILRRYKVHQTGAQRGGVVWARTASSALPSSGHIVNYRFPACRHPPLALLSNWFM